MGRIGPAVLVAFSTYLVLVFLFGPRGLVAYHHRSRYQVALERNLERLTERRDELAAEIARLQEDPDAISTAVREQQVLGSNEWLIRVRDDAGRRILPSGHSATAISPGSVLRRQPPFGDYSPIFRGVAASVGIAVYVLALGLKEKPRSVPSRAAPHR